MKWYAANNANDTQGLVISKDTGENIAVTYKAEYAPIVAMAPEMLEILKDVIKIIKDNPHLSGERLARVSEVWEAQEIINKVTGG